MTADATPVALTRADALRDDFDASFAAAPVRARPATTGLLAVRIGTTPAAVRLADVAGLHADKVITPVPGAPAELVGLAGFRGVPLPVYDLGALLGAPVAGPARWCVVTAGRPAAAFAFHHFDGYLEVPTGSVRRTRDGSSARRDVVTLDGQARSIVELGAVVAAIAARNP